MTRVKVTSTVAESDTAGVNSTVVTEMTTDSFVIVAHFYLLRINYKAQYLTLIAILDRRSHTV